MKVETAIFCALLATVGAAETVKVVDCARDPALDEWAASDAKFARAVMEDVFKAAGVEPVRVPYRADGMSDSSNAVPAEAKDSPAPAPAAPVRQRRAPKTGSALSMNAILQEKEEKPVEEAPAAVEAALPDDDTLRARWKDLLPRYESQPRLASALAKAELRITEEAGVKSVFFTVANAAQKKWIEDKILRDMENAFREILNCRKVNLHVDDIPEEEPGEKKPYMPEEKAKDLMDKHPEVRAFVADLGLDTK